jgi:L,D-transpeptidase YcbB
MKYTLVFIGLFLPAIFNPASAGGLSEQIRFFVENKPEGDRYRIDETRLFSSQLLPRFYYNRFFTPAWLSDAGLSEHAHHLINAIRHVDEHGLQPEDCHLEMIEKYTTSFLREIVPQQEEMMKAEMLMTDAFLLLASHLYFGKVDPEKIDANLKIQRKEPELFLDRRLEAAVASTGVEDELNQLLPRQKNYQIMRGRLARYHEMEKHDWKPIAPGVTLRPGDDHQSISKIRKRLHDLNYKFSDTLSNLYDEVLAMKVMAFQQCHGLNPDGVIGSFTLQALNLTPAQ